jgi:lactoylglutathione lyase
VRTFPVLYTRDVGRAAAFWERLGFERRYSFPEDEPGYVSLRRDGYDVAVTVAEWPAEQYGLAVGAGPRVEMFVYVDDVDALMDALRSEGVPVLREPADMPWGERIATIQDPDGNPVSLANERPVES